MSPKLCQLSCFVHRRVRFFTTQGARHARIQIRVPSRRSYRISNNAPKPKFTDSEVPRFLIDHQVQVFPIFLKLPHHQDLNFLNVDDFFPSPLHFVFWSMMSPYRSNLNPSICVFNTLESCPGPLFPPCDILNRTQVSRLSFQISTLIPARLSWNERWME